MGCAIITRSHRNPLGGDALAIRFSILTRFREQRVKATESECLLFIN